MTEEKTINNENVMKEVEKMLDDKGPAALVVKQNLMPVGGYESVIFPPTFAGQKTDDESESDYNIDTTRNGVKVAIVDTVGSQANRMEPLFKEAEYSGLVPQIEIEAGGKNVNLLEVGHRAADALVRFSTLSEDVQSAFEEYKKTGDASKLAKLAPTSLVFGAWDSRGGSNTKIPRLINSEIRGYDVDVLTRSAQYFPPLKYAEEEGLDKRLVTSDLGLAEVPSTGKPGGIVAHGGIQRNSDLNLVTLRSIGPRDDEKIRPYILSLCLVVLTYKYPHNLRQGCLLVKDPKKPDQWEFVSHDGTRESVEIDHDKVVEFAKQAAKEFGVGPQRSEQFNSASVKTAKKK